MRIVEVWKNPAGSDLKILVEDGADTKQYLAFFGDKEFYIINLGQDRTMEELMKVKSFVSDFLNTIYEGTLIKK
jgi:hypothetical protein